MAGRSASARTSGTREGAYSVGEDDGDVLSVRGNTRPHDPNKTRMSLLRIRAGSQPLDSRLSTLVGPSRTLVGGRDGVAESAGGDGEEDSGETHFDYGEGDGKLKERGGGFYMKGSPASRRDPEPVIATPSVAPYREPRCPLSSPSTRPLGCVHNLPPECSSETMR